jgi:hypothetical protein
MIQPYTLTVQLLKDVKAQTPQAICEMAPQNILTNLLISRTHPSTTPICAGRWRWAWTQGPHRRLG